MKLAPYWLDSTPAFSAGAQGPVEGKVDVAIVGGGFTGLSAALGFARRGASVAVLEAGQVGGGASGRNGGHCNNGFSPGLGAVAERHGMARAVALYRAFDAGVDTVERLVVEEGIDCDFVRTGKIKLAVKPKHYDAMVRGFETLREADPRPSWCRPIASGRKWVRQPSMAASSCRRARRCMWGASDEGWRWPRSGEARGSMSRRG